MTTPHTAQSCSVNPRHELHDDRATWTTCRPCEDHIRRTLDQIQDLWPELPDHLERPTGHAGPRVTGNTQTAAPMPVAENTLDLIGPGGAPDRLQDLYKTILNARGLPALPIRGTDDDRITILTGRLRRHLTWAAEHVNLKPLNDALDTLAADMHAATTSHHQADTIAFADPCTTPLHDGRPCGGTLRYHRQHRTTRCDHCGTHLDMETWRQAIGL